MLTAADTPAFADPLRTVSIHAAAGSSRGFVAVMTSESGASATWRSPDGTSWDGPAFGPATTGYEDVTAMADGSFAISGASGGKPSVFLSGDGQHWPSSAVPGPSDASVISIAPWRAGLIGQVSGGADGAAELVTSNDGHAWSVLPLPADLLGWSRPVATASAIAFVAVTAGGTGVYSSGDGHAWTFSKVGVQGEALTDLAASDNRFVGVHGGTAWISDDGKAWTPTTLFEASGGRGLLTVTASGGGFEALEQVSDVTPARLWTSLDGAAWSDAPLPLPDQAIVADVTSGGTRSGGRIVVVGMQAREPWRGTYGSIVWVQDAAAITPPAPSARPCPTAGPLDVVELLDRSPLNRRDCFDGRTLTFRAYLASSEEGVGPGAPFIEGVPGLPGQVATLYGTGAIPSLPGWYTVAGRFPDLAPLCPDPVACQDQFTIATAVPAPAP